MSRERHHRLRHRASFPRKRQPKGIKLVLEGRCVACHFHCQMTRFFRRSGLEIKAENTMCKVEGCDQLSFRGSGGCTQHLPRLLAAAHRSEATIDHRLVRETFSFMARKRWSFQPHYDIVRCSMYNILQGKRPGSDLVILDDEFSLASKQLWEFAIIERVSGKVLINTTIKHQERMDRDSPGQHPFITWMNRSSASAVYSRSRIQASAT
jgi:hypothetical protein